MAGVILMVMVRHNENPEDAMADAMLHKPGDVVDILPGDAQLSPIEASGYPFLSVYVDGATHDDLSGFLAEQALDAMNPDNLRQRRGFSFDLDQYLKKHGKGARITKDEVMKLKVRKSVRKNPKLFLK